MLPGSSRTARVALVATVAMFALMIVVPSAQAQTASLDVTVPADAPEAFPNGPAGVLNVTVAYTCGTTVGDIALTATAKDDAPGTVTLGASTLTAQTLPDCNPGEPVQVPVELSYAPTVTEIADSQVEVEVTASYDPTGANPEPETASKVAGFRVGPYVDVSFEPNVTAFEAMAGETVPVAVMIKSSSNTMVMAMPSIDGVPPTWERPDVFPTNVPSPLEEGETGEMAMEFEIAVPEDAEGEVTLELTLFAHSLTDTYLATDETTFPFAVTVVPNPELEAAADGESEESPATPAVPLLIAGAALVALARRR